MLRILVLTFLILAGCSGTSPREDSSGSSNSTPDTVPTLPPAPWSGARLSADRVPGVYTAQWQKAENRAECAPLAFTSLGKGQGATPRAATFSGGWGVAYDLPDLRSAFGIAGTGVDASAPSYSEWPYHREWADGSTAGYGPEGGTGPNQLAYLRVKGQECLYNVWSRLGREHLEDLLTQLRFVTNTSSSLSP